MLLEIFKSYISLLLLGLVIKLLDDAVDGDEKLKKYNNNTYLQLIEYKFPYCLLFLSLAMVLTPEISFSLFTSAYMIGMFHFSNKKLPLQLKGYHEIIILIILNLLLVEVRVFTLAFTSMLLIQLVDDIMDHQYDLKYGYKNFVNKFGKGEIIIFSNILLVLCFMLCWIGSIVIFSSSFIINYLYSKI